MMYIIYATITTRRELCVNIAKIKDIVDHLEVCYRSKDPKVGTCSVGQENYPGMQV